MKKKLALAGLGYLGKIHLKILLDHPDWELSGIYDIDQKLCKDLAQQYGLKACTSFDQLLENCDALDVVTPANTHFDLARQAIIKGKHVFIEKPLTDKIEDARILQQLKQEAGVTVQVGHVERFNPAFIAAQPFLKDPRFLEIHRLAVYNPRGTEVSVVFDLMMHDLDLICKTINANVRKISANGAKLVSNTADIANARIEFDNGSVANITTNRLSLKNVRKFRAFTPGHFVSINLLDKITEVVHLKNSAPGSKNHIIDTPAGLPKKELIFEHPVILPQNAIKEELSAFYKSSFTGKESVVSIFDAIHVMELALEIEAQISH